MDNYTEKVVAVKAAEIRKAIKTCILFGEPIDESNQDQMLFAAFMLGESSRNPSWNIDRSKIGLIIRSESMLTTSQPDDLAQQYAARIATIRRHLIGLTRAIDEIEREMLAEYAPQSEGERAAQAARMVTYRQGPSEVKIIK